MEYSYSSVCAIGRGSGNACLLSTSSCIVLLRLWAVAAPARARWLAADARPAGHQSVEVTVRTRRGWVCYTVVYIHDGRRCLRLDGCIGNQSFARWRIRVLDPSYCLLLRTYIYIRAYTYYLYVRAGVRVSLSRSCRSGPTTRDTLCACVRVLIEVLDTGRAAAS